MVRARCEQLRQLYEESVGRPMTAGILKQLLLALLEGMPWQYYEYALEEAAAAPQPSWRYALAIVQRLSREQVPTDHVRDSLQLKRQQGRRILAEQDYTQREYVHDESRLDAMMAELLNQRKEN